MKILYLLKKNLIYGGYNSVIARSGLLNSARITSGQLEKHLRVRTDIEICVDGNEIDKFLTRHKPRICIIEAIWVTPQKLKQLTRLHRDVIFIVLVHSEVPFLATEGNALSWIKLYNDIDSVFPAFNSKAAYDQFKMLGLVTFYLPNVYLDVRDKRDRHSPSKEIMNIGCFGAIRPFKNQLIQAIAGIVFAEKHGKKLHFHMNTTRTEQGGESVFKNIVALFEGTKHRLIEHGWKDREGFLELVSKMDLGLQLSFTESFNIVAADFVHENVPIIGGKTIDWLPDSQISDVEGMEEIIKTMEYSYHKRLLVSKRAVRALNRYNEKSLKVWREFLFLFK